MISPADSLAESAAPKRRLQEGTYELKHGANGLGIFPSPQGSLSFQMCPTTDAPDLARAERSLSRAAMLLLMHASWLRRGLHEAAFTPPRTGLYLALENGPVGSDLLKQMSPKGNFSQEFRAAFPPKQYLRYLVCVAPAQLAQALDARGPLAIFNHSQNGAIHAWNQASFDLQTRVIDHAVVAAVFAREDPIATARADTDGKKGGAREFSGALLFSRDHLLKPPAYESSSAYGIASPLADFFLREEADA